MRISLDVQASHLVRAEMLALLRDVRLRTAVRFYRFRGEHLDVLVNNVWGGYERMVENGEFTWSLPFWRQPLWRWDAMFCVGVRAHYVAARLAARGMVEQRRGLIVNLSFWAAQKHIGNVPYGPRRIARLGPPLLPDVSNHAGPRVLAH
jgi:NAD(P)-dependent dehydrogenase (short-subunit alcohol dehydrogenase family)